MYVNNKYLHKFGRFALVAGSVLLLGGPFLTGCRVRPSDTKPASEVESAKPAIPAPHFISVRDGAFALDSFKGQPLVVSVQGAGTPYLAANLRELDAISKDLRASGVAVVGLLTAFEEGEDPVAVAKENPVSLPLAVAVPDFVREVAKVRALPTVLLVDDRGTVRKQYPGDVSLEELKADVQALAGQH